jgi:uncharacterized protein YodC (DUF2158 family)
MGIGDDLYSIDKLNPQLNDGFIEKKSQSSKFNEGDLVQLKSGGPPMTVEYISCGDIRTVKTKWFSEDGDVISCRFKEVMLKKY